MRNSQSSRATLLARPDGAISQSGQPVRPSAPRVPCTCHRSPPPGMTIEALRRFIVQLIPIVVSSPSTREEKVPDQAGRRQGSVTCVECLRRGPSTRTHSRHRIYPSCHRRPPPPPSVIPKVAVVSPVSARRDGPGLRGRGSPSCKSARRPAVRFGVSERQPVEVVGEVRDGASTRPTRRTVPDPWRRLSRPSAAPRQRPTAAGIRRFRLGGRSRRLQPAHLLASRSTCSISRATCGLRASDCTHT